MFGVGQEERVLRDSPAEGFFFQIYTLSDFCDILGLPIGVAPHYKMGRCWLCGSECVIFDSSPFFIVHHVAWLPTPQDSRASIPFGFFRALNCFKYAESVTTQIDPTSECVHTAGNL